MRVAFDSFVFDSERRQLYSSEQAVHLGPKAFRLLEILIANRPRPLRKQELHESIWQDTVVDESNLAGLINELRAALGDRARKPRFIRTVHGYGYAFCVVSRKHAEIEVRRESATIEDLSSKNGTFVDGVKLGTRVPLCEGQTIVLGDASILFRRSATSGSTQTISRMKRKS